jgi:hypothetical protein
LVALDDAEAVERVRDRGVLRPVQLLVDRERALDQLLGH